MKKFLLSNKIYFPIVVLLITTMFYGAYYVGVNYAQSEDSGLVLGASESYVNEYFLPLSGDRNPEYSKDFFEPENFPQKVNKGDMPILESASAFVYSPSNDYVFIDKNSEREQPIASITKLMTALVFLETKTSWENIYEIKREDRVDGGRIYLYLGDKVRVIDLFNLSLVASANTATKALVSSVGISEEEFVKKMNEKAISLGLKNTKFVDPVGISPLNVSTARDLAVLIKTAIEKEEIRSVIEKKEYNFKTLDGQIKTAVSTDNLLDLYPKNGISFLGGKTGYIDAAGFCFVGVFKNEKGELVVSVVLGANSPYSRFEETDNLISWVYSSFVW